MMLLQSKFNSAVGSWQLLKKFNLVAADRTSSDIVLSHLPYPKTVAAAYQRANGFLMTSKSSQENWFKVSPLSLSMARPHGLNQTSTIKRTHFKREISCFLVRISLSSKSHSPSGRQLPLSVDMVDGREQRH